MNIHDNIELPELPEWADTTLQGEDRDSLIAWAEAAIEADRQKRRLKERAQLDQEWAALKDMQAQYEADRKRRGEDQEPFGYFRALPFGWTDCAATDDGAIALYERPQAQGEPVAWHTEDHLTDKSATTYDPVVADRWRAKGWPVHCLYAAPQPVEPLKYSHDRSDLYVTGWNDCVASMSNKPGSGSQNGECESQPAEPVKVPSDDELFAIHDEYFPVMFVGHENYLRFARTLLARYGQPT